MEYLCIQHNDDADAYDHNHNDIHEKICTNKWLELCINVFQFFHWKAERQVLFFGGNEINPRHLFAFIFFTKLYGDIK